MIGWHLYFTTFLITILGMSNNIFILIFNLVLKIVHTGTWEWNSILRFDTKIAFSFPLFSNPIFELRNPYFNLIFELSNLIFETILLFLNHILLLLSNPILVPFSYPKPRKQNPSFVVWKIVIVEHRKLPLKNPNPIPLHPRTILMIVRVWGGFNLVSPHLLLTTPPYLCEVFLRGSCITLGVLVFIFFLGRDSVKM